MLVGRLVHTPILNKTKNEVSVVKVSFAVNNKWRPNEEAGTTFIDVVFWDKTAENVAKYQKKGSLLFIEGVLEQRRYTNRAGENRTTYEVIADRVIFLEPKSIETQDSVEKAESPQYNRQPVITKDPEDYVSSKMAEYDDLPFY